MTITKLTLRGSNRLKEERRIVDESSRKRRHRKMVEMLESDNYHDDPHADLVMSKKIPKFDDNLEGRTRNKKKERTSEYFQTKYRKNFHLLLEEEATDSEQARKLSYNDIAAEESELPPRHFCTVCGYFGNYACLTCGMRYCSIRCMGMHLDTRCLRWSN